MGLTYSNAPMMFPWGKYSHTKYLAACTDPHVNGLATKRWARTHPKASREDAIAGLHGASNLLRALPDDLGEVGRLGVARVIVGYACAIRQYLHVNDPEMLRTNFIRPRLDGGCNAVAAPSSGSEVLWK